MPQSAQVAALRKALSDVESALAAAGEAGDAIPRPETPLATALAALVQVANGIGRDEWQRVRTAAPDLLAARDWLAPLHGRAIFEQEVRAAASLEHEQSEHGQPPVGAMNAWGKKAYDRVEDLFDNVDLSACRRFLLVGSGPLPVTLLHVHERTSIETLVAVDTSAFAIASLGRLCDRFGLTRFVAQQADGLEVDFRGADVIYLANLVSPKRAILERVGQQVTAGTVVVVREPAGIGELFAEPATAPLPAGFEEFGAGRDDPNFLSRHVFLRRTA